MDGAQGLVDLDWSQRMPIFHPDDIDCDPWFSQYPLKKGDDYEDDDEEGHGSGEPAVGWSQ